MPIVQPPLGHRAAAAAARWRHAAAAAWCALALLAAVRPALAGDDALGSPGMPLRLEVGVLPYAASTWSAAVMRDKRFFDKHLPAGSAVVFVPLLDGGKVAAALAAGQQQIGYLDDALAVASSSASVVAALGVAFDQCSVLLVRADAPRIAGAAAALDWLAGRTLAVPPGGCMERFARTLVERAGARAPTALASEPNIETLTAAFRAGRIDAAVLSEPAASRLVGEGSARRVASGAQWRQRTAAGLAMSRALIERRPDVVEAWLRAELQAQRFLADPANAAEVVRIVAAQTSGFEPYDLWQALYGEHAELEGGARVRLALPFAFDDDAALPWRGEFARRLLDGAREQPGAKESAGALGRREPGSATPPLRREVLALAPPPALAARGAVRSRIDIRVEPLGWRGGDARRIAVVLEAVARELLLRFPGRPLAPIAVSRSARAPVALYERGPGGETRIELAASGDDAGPYVYEFAHELCHVLANHERHPHHAVTRRHQWFEEALCEAASLYTLRALARDWQRAPPSAELAVAAPQLQRIAERMERESHRRLPAGATLAAWYRREGAALERGAYQRERNEVVANLLLPLFDENPELWEAIGFLNLDAPGETFQQYLQNWLDNAPPRYHDAIRYATSLFFARDGRAADGTARWPARPLEIIVGFGPGGGADGMARELARLLEPQLGVPVVVSNVPGAAGNAGLTRLLLDADADHTLATLTALTAAAWAGGVGTLTINDLAPLGVAQVSPSMLFVAAASPIADFRAFLDRARAQPGTLRVATSGRGTIDDVTLAQLAARGFGALNAPYAKPEERYAAALDGRVDALFEEPGDVQALLDARRLRPLVVFASSRHPAFPEVPAVAEFGLPLAELPNFRGLVASARIVPERARALTAALHRVLAGAPWQRYCARTHTCTPIDTPAAARERVQALVLQVAATLEGLPR